MKRYNCILGADEVVQSMARSPKHTGVGAVRHWSNRSPMRRILSPTSEIAVKATVATLSISLSSWMAILIGSWPKTLLMMMARLISKASLEPQRRPTAPRLSFAVFTPTTTPLLIRFDRLWYEMRFLIRPRDWEIHFCWSLLHATVVNARSVWCAAR